MLEAIKGWVSNIIAVILFVSIVELILPEGKMRKYVSLIAGVLVVFIIVSPLVSAFNKDIQIEMPEMSMKEPVPIEELKLQGEKIGTLRSKQIVEAYKTKIQKSIQEQVNEVSEINCERVVCKVKEDTSKQEFGDIEEITLYITIKDKGFDNSKIEPVKIQIGNSKENNTDKSVEISKEIKNKIIKNISYTCRINSEHIKIISLQNR